MSERCKQTSERRSKWPSALRVDFIVILPIVEWCAIRGRNATNGRQCEIEKERKKKEKEKKDKCASRIGLYTHRDKQHGYDALLVAVSGGPTVSHGP